MATARIGARHRFNSTPASIAFASEDGIAATARPNGRHSPAITINAPLNRNAPTAAGNPPSGIAEDANNAPPGVDHAMLMGSRYHRLSRIAQTPIPTAKAIKPDADWAGDAPTEVKPRSTTANEDAKPTNAASMPANSVCRVTQR